MVHRNPILEYYGSWYQRVTQRADCLEMGGSSIKYVGQEENIMQSGGAGKGFELLRVSDVHLSYAKKCLFNSLGFGHINA